MHGERVKTKIGTCLKGSRHYVVVEYNSEWGTVKGNSLDMNSVCYLVRDNLLSWFTAADPCLNNPCGNGGTCVANDVSFSCTCAGSWSGERCESCDIADCDSCSQTRDVCTQCRSGLDLLADGACGKDGQPLTFQFTFLRLFPPHSCVANVAQQNIIVEIS